LCTFGVSSDPAVDDEVARVLRQFRDEKKPIGMCCISPIIAAMLFAGKDGIPVFTRVFVYKFINDVKQN
jgi:enhancing lycopene biosynthesis protein 2